MNIYGFDDNGNKIKIGEYRQVLPVGGTIFYADNTSDGVYKLYDENLIETQVLTDAKYYEVVTVGNKNKYYVYDSTTGLVEDKYWGYYNIVTGATANSIGSGKTNTATILAVSDTSQYATSSIFTYLSNTQNAGTGVGGYTDWFVGSKAEYDQLRSSGLVNYFTDKNLWSSVESSTNGGMKASSWSYSSNNWDDAGSKHFQKGVVFLRSF